MALRWSLCLFFMCIFFKVTPTEASSWSATVPSSVKGLLGSCVVIPCSYNYPDPQISTTSFTGIWYNKDNQVICHSDKSQTSGQFRNRTKLLGDLSKKNCSLMIDDLQQSDVGPLYFRIEIKGYDQYSYKNNKVSVSVSQPVFSVQEVKEGENVSASCSVFHSCPTYPPSFIWSHSGEQHDQTQQLHEGQWNSTSTLTFRPNHSDHNKPLKCNITYHRGLHLETSKILQVRFLTDGPDIKTSSKCSSEDGVVKCECIVESEPPSMVYFILGDRVMQSSKAEKNGSVTIETLQTDFGSFRFVHCLANNMLGYDNILLSLPVNDNMQNILISTGAGVILLIILIGSGVGVVKKCRGRSRDITTNLSTMMSDRPVELPHSAPPKRKMSRKDIPSPDMYTNYPVYGNTDWDESIYANV
ncbi:sialic acid-binding Ig-like lectin 12 isoform X1 [Simochromis diagramma]|uniref:sialic acid-binding Ig-like lectin 12 isoform X1 n=1 Tax=Simochromis diagramma TaxID=43689 RepID=UPI001A7E3B83|nr:sialic acid-binding Ig-like lectin 12 isoform X1 [Simochromis diagramma]